MTTTATTNGPISAEDREKAIALNRVSTVLDSGLTAMEFCALADGDKIKTILYIRSRTGCGLSDAKKLMDSVLVKVY